MNEHLQAVAQGARVTRDPSLYTSFIFLYVLFFEEILWNLLYKYLRFMGIEGEKVPERRIKLRTCLSPRAYTEEKRSEFLPSPRNMKKYEKICRNMKNI